MNKKARLSGTWILFLVFAGVIFLTSLVIIMAVSASSYTQQRISSTSEVNINDPIEVEVISPVESNGGIPVNIQDQTTPPLDIYFTQAKGAPTQLQEATAIDDTTINITSTVNFAVGDYIGVFSSTGRFYFGEILSISGTILTLDTPLDFTFSVGDNVVSTTRELKVDGSSAPQYFSIRGAGPGTDVVIDITRIIIKMTTASTPDYGKFGDINGGLTNGIVLRRVDGNVRNIFNVKLNADFANLAYDLNVLQATNPGQGVNGLVCRLTFSGQDKHGVAIRLEPGDELQIIIQDDLTSLESFRIIAEGHIVQD